MCGCVQATTLMHQTSAALLSCVGVGEETSADTFTDFLCDTPETVFGRPVSLALSPFVAVREGRSPPSSPLVAAPSADCGLATPRGEALAARDTVTGLP